MSPFVIPNPWDPGLARVLEALGFSALATTSSGFAFTLGRLDGSVTLDEVIEHTAALDPATALPPSEEGNRFKLDDTMSSAALLLGRRTYQGFAAAWPGPDGEFADKFNTMPKYVVSSTLRDPEWTNSTVLYGDVVDEQQIRTRRSSSS